MRELIKEAVAKAAKHQLDLKRNPDDIRKTQIVHELFTSKEPMMGPMYNGGILIKVDQRPLATVRVRRLLFRQVGFAWIDWSLQEMIDWLVENWDKVLRVLLSIIAFFII